MQTFSYAKPSSVDKAVAGASAGKFIAGGTTLVDLMKLSVEQPQALVVMPRSGKWVMSSSTLGCSTSSFIRSMMLVPPAM